MDREAHRRRVLQVLLRPEDGLLENAKWCWASPAVPRLAHCPEPLQFFRDFVSRNTPCVLAGGLGDFRLGGGVGALERRLGRKPVRVNCTPNGRADSVVADGSGARVFAMPEERVMPFAEFARWLRSAATDDDDEVLYISAQNDSLRSEYGELFADASFAPRLVERFATAVFGKAPDAVNLWVGGARSVSVMHRDTYENMYCCVAGTKVFHLLPPCAVPFMLETDFPNAQWRAGELVPVPGATPWIERDLVPDAGWLPELVRSMVQRVELRAGECLYLPSGWLHRVSQSEDTVAVNYWYDRELNSSWALLQAIDQILCCYDD